MPVRMSSRDGVSPISATGIRILAEVVSRATETNGHCAESPSMPTHDVQARSCSYSVNHQMVTGRRPHTFISRVVFRAGGEWRKCQPDEPITLSGGEEGSPRDGRSVPPAVPQVASFPELRQRRPERAATKDRPSAAAINAGSDTMRFQMASARAARNPSN